MKDFLFVTRLALGLAVLAAGALGIAGCSSAVFRAEPGSFAAARSVLESNCVHCHGHERLAQMPGFRDTAELGQLIGPGNWIIPNHPESSRFLRVVTLADEQPGAMPPTGHALTRAQIEALRDWITVGAPLPKDKTVALTPRGRGPRP